VKRNSLVLSIVLFILAAFAWAGWANFEYRKQARERLLAIAPQGELIANPAGGAPQYVTPFQGKPAPPFTLEDLGGEKRSLASYKGKAVLINFWATWCAPCKIETPWLIELRNQYAAQGFEVLGISADDIDRGDPGKLSDEKRQIARFDQPALRRPGRVAHLLFRGPQRNRGGRATGIDLEGGDRSQHQEGAGGLAGLARLAGLAELARSIRTD